MRVLWHAIDGLGLGHVTRLLSIARAIREREPRWEHLFLTNSDAEGLIERDGFPAFKVPSRTTVARIARSSLHTKLVQAATLSVATAYDPHILVADTLPAGSYHELLALLHWPIFRVFVFREQRSDAAANTAFQQLLQAFHLIVIPHQRPTMRAFCPPGSAVRWSGEILSVDRAHAFDRPSARRRLGLPTTGTAWLITAGGGLPRGRQFVRQAVDAIRIVEPRTHIAYAPGAFGVREGLPAECRVLDAYPLARYLRAFDGAVATAGYNTFNELMHFGIPTAFVPMDRQLDDQGTRALSAELVGAAVLARARTRDGLTAAIARMRSRAARRRVALAARQLVPANGADVAADAIVRSVLAARRRSNEQRAR